MYNLSPRLGVRRNSSRFCSGFFFFKSQVRFKCITLSSGPCCVESIKQCKGSQLVCKSWTGEGRTIGRFVFLFVLPEFLRGTRKNRVTELMLVQQAGQFFYKFIPSIYEIRPSLKALRQLIFYNKN